jgi:hypothetical protein
MNASNNTAQSSTSAGMQDAMQVGLEAANDDDFALGWECANPALQIDAWDGERVSQPLQSLI